MLDQADLTGLNGAWAPFQAIAAQVLQYTPEQILAAGQAVGAQYEALKKVYDADLAKLQAAQAAEVAQLKADVIGSLSYPNWVAAGNINELAMKYTGMTFAALLQKTFDSQFSTSPANSMDINIEDPAVWASYNVRR